MVDAKYVLDGFTGGHYIADGFCSAPAVSNLMRDIITEMTKTSIGKYVFSPGTCEPGMDNYESVFRTIIKNLEK